MVGISRSVSTGAEFGRVHRVGLREIPRMGGHVIALNRALRGRPEDRVPSSRLWGSQKKCNGPSPPWSRGETNCTAPLELNKRRRSKQGYRQVYGGASSFAPKMH